MGRRFKIRNRFPRSVNSKSRYIIPQHLDVEILPSGKLDAFEVMNIIPRPAKPETVVCDCCLQTIDRAWIRHHRGFGTGWREGGRHRVEYTAGWWGFCVYCWALFNKNEINVLIARVCTLNEDIDPVRINQGYYSLASAVYGEMIYWEAGQVLTIPAEVDPA
jgi:hypothetical protein